MRRDAEFFGDMELPLIYIAKRLKDALALEKMLTEAGLDYLVETDTYRGGIIFASERVGAFFYVAAEQEQQARQAMLTHGWKPYASR
ncbi:MAG TPA: hypothetical protein VFL57_13100 [Bryobacteraceae bacterium]|nr:hypothetical protein [Bryobacteraceae bacterium]